MLDIIILDGEISITRNLYLGINLLRSMILEIWISTVWIEYVISCKGL